MRIGRVDVGVLLCVVLALPVADAVAQSPAAMTDSNVQPRVGAGELPQIDVRRRVLLAQMMADPSNLDIAFEYAALSTKAGDLEGAISTLERMLIFAPGLPRLHLELGVLYYRLGAFESASSYFEAALAAPNVPQQVRDKVEPYLADIAKRSEVGGFGGAISTGVRYQSNANNGPSSDIISLNGLNFTLSDDATSAPDANAFVSGSLVYSRDLASQGDRFIATLLTYGAFYAEYGTLNTGVVEATAGPSFNLQRFHIDDATLGIYGIASGVLLGEDPYILSGGVGANLQKGFGPRTRAGLSLETRLEEYQDSDSRPTASDRTGDKVRASWNLQYLVSRDLSLFGALSGERRDTEVGYLSLWEVGATIGARLQFDAPFLHQARPWLIVVSTSYRQRDYDEPDPIINIAEAEVDREVFTQGTLSIPLEESWSVQTTASYRVVTSNYDMSNSDNFAASLGVMKTF